MADPLIGAASAPDPVYKDGQRPVVASVARLPQACADLVGGLFAATGEGFDAFSNELNDQNLLRVGADNGFVSGSVRASRQFFLRLAEVSDRVYARLRTTSVADAQIDYELLADKVADRLQKKKIVVP